ncbi:putative late blight resistance protein-like protein R1A-10 [Forsythia ovata]|uniref:Late blight resistance protein-like protein R1A-10 n=1 Tax=Forsythia ovata TaxID=205694 RepID=A0ABD1XC10_9LAMI
MTIVGSLPNLQVLKLIGGSFVGLEWEPKEGEFLQLKYLRLCEINLENWIANNIHFPSLVCLVIDICEYLEIPCGIGEIPTLELIKVYNCSDSVVTSAKQIEEEQHSSGNDYLQRLPRRSVFAAIVSSTHHPFPPPSDSTAFSPPFNSTSNSSNSQVSTDKKVYNLTRTGSVLVDCNEEDFESICILVDHDEDDFRFRFQRMVEIVGEEFENGRCR